MKVFDWKECYKDQIGAAEEAVKVIKSGNSIFIGSACGEPQHLVNALVEHSGHIHDVKILHLLTMGVAPYVEAKYRGRFQLNTFFVAKNVREAISAGRADYTPISLWDIPRQFESGRIPVDVAMISVSPPDEHGLCSLGVSVDITKSAVANANYVVAQVNANMPRTHGSGFIHVNSIDMLVPRDEDVITVPPVPVDDTLRQIGRNLARLVEDGSTIELGIGSVPQALAESLRKKRDLGVHTEMFGDWIMDLIESGAVTCSKKTINRGKVVASFCMGSRKLYDYIDNNPLFEFHPTEYVNDPYVISQHERMVAINVALEVDLTGQVCADSLGYDFYSGIGGQVDFIRGAARSRSGKAIIALPSTARNHEVSRIVSHLAEGAGVVTTRADVHYVVTEYGIAYLHGKSIRQRVLALINVAHPKFRNELLQHAKKHNYIYADQIELPWDKVNYPEELQRYATLTDGREIFFRPIKPADEPALSEMLYSLSDESVHKRYISHSTTFPHRDVQQLANIDYQNDMAIVGTVPGPGGQEEIVALAQYFLEPDGQSAEVAFIVHDEWQQKGMGSFLLDYLTEIAVSRGVKRFLACVMPANKPMLSIFENSGYNVTSKFDGEVYSISYDLVKPKQ